MMAKNAFSPFKVLASSPPSILVSYFSSLPQFNPLRNWRPQAEQDLTVAVWWDVGNCRVPEGVDPSRVRKAIKAAVQANGMKGMVKISVVADVFQLPRRTWKTFDDYQIKITHIPIGDEQDSYKTNLMRWVSKNPPPAHLFLITDRDFASTLHDLREKNYNILVASNEVPDVFCSDSSIVWRWNDLVKGEISTGKCLNQPPWRPNSSTIDTNNDGEAELPSSKHISQNQSIHQVVEVVTRLRSTRETNERCDHIKRRLGKGGWPASSIHEDKTEAERCFVLSKFKCGRSPILVATDVAARGIDETDIKWVINYDFPTSLEDYIHRIGRADANGTALTFVTHANAEFAGELIKILTETQQVVPPALSDLARSAPSFGGGNSDPEDEAAVGFA